MPLPPLGLDISQLKFNACLLRAGGQLRHQVFPNHPEGFARLSEWLGTQGVAPAPACLEATGTAGDALAAYRHAHRHTVSIVNPAQIRAYAQSVPLAH